MEAVEESALVVLVPQVEALVRSFRERYDPSSGDGMPAHITVLYPFRPPSRFDEELMGALRTLFSAQPSFAFSLIKTAVFPDVLYLEPHPAEAFIGLTEAVTDRFPDVLPYGGVHDEVVPHLTVAQVAQPVALRQVVEEFGRASRGAFPLRAGAEKVSLMAKTQGAWASVQSFRLGMKQ